MNRVTPTRAMKDKFPLGTVVEYVGHCDWAWGAIGNVIGYREHTKYPALVIEVTSGLHPRWPFKDHLGKPKRKFAPDPDEVRVVESVIQ